MVTGTFITGKVPVGKYPKTSVCEKVITGVRWERAGPVRKVSVAMVNKLVLMAVVQNKTRNLDYESISRRVWKVLPSVEEELGPVSDELVAQLCALTAFTSIHTIVWNRLKNWSKEGRYGASHSKWRAIGIERVPEGYNRIVVHWGTITEAARSEWEERACKRGEGALDIFIVPKGELTAEKMPSGPAWVYLGAITAGGSDSGEGEIWFKGGREAWAELTWDGLRKADGVEWAREVEGAAPSLYCMLAREVVGTGRNMLGLHGGAEERSRMDNASSTFRFKPKIKPLV